MKRTFTIFVTYLAVIATGLAAYTAIGIARNSDDPAAAGTVRALGDALEQGDGPRACEQFTDGARDEIERSRRKPCEQGVLEIRTEIEPNGEPAVADRAESSSIVPMTGGGAYFLDKTPAGWRISAAGCERQAEVPYECEVAG